MNIPAAARHNFGNIFLIRNNNEQLTDITDHIYAGARVEYKGDSMTEKKKKRPRQIPPVNSTPCIELSGNREAVLEGCRGVLEYSPEAIRVNTAGMIVSFLGRELDLRCISESALIIAGFITHIEFTV